MTETQAPRLQVFSDLHLEFFQHREQVTTALERSMGAATSGTACVLAGDIAVPTGRRRRWLDLAVEFFSARFEAVFFVPGNHEFYRAPAPVALERLRKLAAAHPKVTLLEPGVIAKWGDHRVVGATLWFRDGPNNPRLAGGLSDFAEIEGFVPWVYDQNRQHVAWLDEMVREGDIVVTHHLPSRRSVAHRYEGDPLNAFFVCDQTGLIETRRPALWVHGHTHDSFRYTLGATTILCNPRGYPGEENPAFDEGGWS
ncbi:MAG: metallophosphoesterase [Anaeromyxobacter sp.]